MLNYFKGIIYDCLIILFGNIKLIKKIYVEVFYYLYELKNMELFWEIFFGEVLFKKIKILEIKLE